MKILAYVTKIGKELFSGCTLLLCTLCLNQLLIYFLYLLAYSTHIPLTNFDQFMRELLIMISFGWCSVGFFHMFLKRNYWRVLLPLCLFWIGIGLSTVFEMNLELFEKISTILYFCTVGSVLFLLIFSTGYRVVLTQLFRQFFTERELLGANKKN